MENKLRIKEVAAEKGTNLKEVAKKLDLNYVAFCNTLRKNPTLGTLERIANALEVPISELFEKKDFLAIVVEGDSAKLFRNREELKNSL